MKTAIFVVGDAGSGKSSVIRALTGYGGRVYLWEVRNLAGNPINAFILLMSLQEDAKLKNIKPNPHLYEEIENEKDVRHDDYELFVCPLQINPAKPGLYNFDEYLQAFIDSNEFDVRIALIENSWNTSQVNVTRVKNFIASHNLRSINLDVNNDEHLEARKVRDNLYP